MQQVFRRQLLAMGRMNSDVVVDEQCHKFVRSVLGAALELRPDTQGVRDVLTSAGASTAATDRFVDAFDAAVWSGPVRSAVTPA